MFEQVELICQTAVLILIREISAFRKAVQREMVQSFGSRKKTVILLVFSGNWSLEEDRMLA